MYSYIWDSLIHPDTTRAENFRMVDIKINAGFTKPEMRLMLI